MTRYIRVGTSALALIIAVAAVTWLSSHDAFGAGAFAPCASGGPTDTTPGAASDLTGTFGVAIGPDCLPNTPDDTTAEYNTGGLITFTPPEWFIAPDADIEDGAEVGSFNSLVVLGLLNNPCTNQLPVAFNVFDGTTDTSNSIDALPPGTANRLENLIEDNNGDGIPDGADQWPSYLTTVAADNDWDLSKLIARPVGFSSISGANTIVVLNFMIFEPGSHVSENFNLDPRLGYPTVTVLQDPTQVASGNDAITDFCSPLSVNVSIPGTVGGNTYRANPTEPGTYYFTTFTVAQPDADGDGIENLLDPCQEDADPDFDPRALPIQHVGDRDGDGIPNSCDPFPDEKSKCTAAGISKTDEDCDGWMNRADNCSVDANPNQEDADSDGIGDVCDSTPNERSDVNNFLTKCIITPVVIGSGGPVGQDPSIYQPCGTEPLPIDPADPSAGDTGTGTGTDTGTGGTGGTGSTGSTGGTGGTGGTSGGVGGGPDSGIGSLAPTGSDVPLWAVLLAALGVLGVAGSLILATGRRQ